MKQDGLERMLDFLNRLNEKNIHFFIEQHAPDYLTVTLTLIGYRIEVMFSVEEMTYSIFKGNEDILLDKRLLDDLIAEETADG